MYYTHSERPLEVRALQKYLNLIYRSEALAKSGRRGEAKNMLKVILSDGRFFTMEHA